MSPRTTLSLLAVLLVAPAARAAEAKPPPDVPPCPSADEKPDVVALVRRTEQLMDGRSSISVMVMKIVTPSWNRQLKLKVWAKGRDLALVRVVEAGPRETGMMTLKREKQLWNYLPQAGRVMKLPSGMLGDSWLGSDFTNDDLVKGSSIVDDYTAGAPKVVQQDGKSAWHVTLTPKPNAVVVWGKVELVVDRATCVPLAQRYYDEDGQVARQLDFADVRQVGWRAFPGRVTVTPAEKGRQTIITYDSQEFDVDIPDDTFSLHRLQQGK